VVDGVTRGGVERDVAVEEARRVRSRSPAATVPDAARPVPPTDVAEPADLVAAIRARRGGSLLNLDRMILHSPPFARGFDTR
jgi:hypothetical protein